MTQSGAHGGARAVPAPPEGADRVFGANLPTAVRFAEMLAEHGVDRGLIGPREVDRLWDRHLLNSAVIAELLPEHSRVVDVGSGAGLPGIPLLIARPDLGVTLLEPMARRVAWLNEVVDRLGLRASVIRGRAEEVDVRQRLRGCDAVTARAVAPLSRLATWCLPLLRPGGTLLALKGASAEEELARDADSVLRAGGCRGRIVTCGVDVMDVPTTVVLIERENSPRHHDGMRPRRKDR
ncbi:16S rRNA (guanine(527)-N(7))-methyltransferase RsmG [Gandjariella thermophila]|uniref:Ribosomal RNA small subunit methyltransferase G n=1 Tax=Gandjariella thermophila TaxID=1931992 RepID=A0A4D4J361_9PSEU|nr:16S rRNA (guanine(527)-N(7))-methyltransferase RsmG [Gandjariella thermophila]GDY30931.1 ribosomal RNA small subunit methyltransferase G [Gandjariella thermophila]